MRSYRYGWINLLYLERPQNGQSAREWEVPLYSPHIHGPRGSGWKGSGPFWVVGVCLDSMRDTDENLGIGARLLEAQESFGAEAQ